jgi:GMC oxidoreductase
LWQITRQNDAARDPSTPLADSPQRPISLRSERRLWRLAVRGEFDAIGAADDPRAMVDPECGVISVEGLRVIDCSFMPEIGRANTHLSTVMIAELMADRLRARRLAR